MKVSFEHEFKKGFFLSEESLIKIDDIIKNRFNNEVIDISFRIFRIDGVLIESDSINSILEEENAPRNFIQRIVIEAETDSHYMLLEFDTEESISLSIISDSRDFANLLIADLKEYINSEVLKFSSLDFYKLKKLILALLMISIMWYMAFVMYNVVSLEQSVDIEKLSSSLYLNAKLNYLIQNRASSNGEGMFLPMLAGICVAITLVLFPIEKLIRYIFPKNIFYWGKRKSLYDKYKETRDKFFWGVVIAFIIAVVSGIFLNYLNP